MTANAELWHRSEAIFLEALECAEPERTAVLERRCAGDSTLLAELRALLAACEAEEAHGAASGFTASVEYPYRIGPYAVEHLLGRGGMGAVYLARRSDGQFDQRVAIKVIDTPLATEAFRMRFRAERQILAGLAHPYIARLLDGGVAETGEPYLAMEYIDGVSLVLFSNRERLSIADRLQLFLKVLEAVQYAHGNLVVHRDLKPDNILVSADGTPHLLDFGTARLLSPDPVPGDLTAAGLHLFTPRYASPEQVLGKLAGIASDLYSLGVVLYLLLTDRLPYVLTEMSVEEMVRVVCHGQPQRPGAGALPHGGFGPDLDSIVLKALRKQPQDRFTTAQQFAEDVQAYLDRRPVKARQGNLRYVLGKFLERNRLPVASAAALVLLTLAGIGGIVRQSRLAERQRVRAEARSADLRELSNSLLTELNSALKEIPGSTGAQHLLITRVLVHLDRAAADAGGDRQTELDLIDAYTRLGNVQGNLYYQNLADTGGAMASFGKALALARPLAATHPGDREVLRMLAATLEAKGEVMSDMGDADASTSLLREAVQTYDRVTAMPGVTAPLIFEAAIAYETLGNELGQDDGMADPDGATAAYQKALEMDEEALRLDPAFAPVRRGIPLMYMHLGAVRLDTDPAYALQEFTLARSAFESLPESEQRKRPQRSQHALYLRKQAQADAELGRYSQARTLFAEAYQLLRPLVDADAKDMKALGDLKRNLDAWAQCEEYAAEPEAAGSAAEVHEALGAAAKHLEEEAAILQRIIGSSSDPQGNRLELAGVDIRLSAVHARLHRASDAAETTRTAANLALLAGAADRPAASALDLETAATAYLEAEPRSLRRPALAVRWAERAVVLSHSRSAAFLLLLAQAQRADGHPDEAATAARQGLTLMPAPGTNQPEAHLRKLLEAECAAPKPSQGE